MMSIYRDLVDEFFTRYEHPVIEPFILGFSGIDPQKLSPHAVSEHELLNGLLGGDPNGHFHVSKEQLQWIIEQMNEKFPPSITPNQVILGTADEKINDYPIQGSDVRP